MDIVLVDPSRVIHCAIGRLAQARGHALHAFATGTDALGHLAGEGADLVLISLDLSDESALELCGAARAAAPPARQPRVLAMGGPNARAGIAQALAAGAVDYLDLPFCELRFAARLRVYEELAEAYAAQPVATGDPLTHALGRGAFIDRLRATAASLPLDVPAALALIDVDAMRALNERCGHAKGDAALADIAAALAGIGGIVGRMGGDEFGWLMAGFDRDAAIEACGDLRLRLAALAPLYGSDGAPVTASIGLVSCRPGATAAELLRRASRALDAAKRSGRDRTITEPAAQPLRRAG